MGASSFNDMEKDALGEMMNISLGASATAMSTLLGATVNITTPVVRILTREEFEFKKLEPAVGVEIAYVEGLEGSNIMMFSRNDVRIIVGTLMGQEILPEEFELDEINRSAICEVMNQMMGSSATAMSEFLKMTVNISTPVSFEIEDEKSFKEKYFPAGEPMVVIGFTLEIVGKLESEFLNIMPQSLAKRLLEPFADTLHEAVGKETVSNPEESQKAAYAQEEVTPKAPAAETSQPETPAPEAQASQPETPAPAAQTSQPEINAAAAQSSQPEITAAAAQSSQLEITAAGQMTESAQAAAEAAPTTAKIPQLQPVPPQWNGMPQGGYAPAYGMAPSMDPAFMQLINQMQQSQMQMMEMMRNMNEKPREQRNQSQGSMNVIRPSESPQLESLSGDGQEETANQEMLMGVPLEISVEIGRTKKLVKDILEFTQGSLVVLDKMAGEQADLYVNGQCVARGDIVVVEDNFGIRITEIVTRNLNQESL